MSVRDVMSGYFDALETGRFAQYFTGDVTWTTMADGAQVKGPQAVQDAINTLHGRLTDLQTLQLVLGPHTAYIEGSATVPAGAGRVAYCVAYDVIGDRIAAMRAYGQLNA